MAKRKERSLIEYVAKRIRELRTSYGGKGLSQEALAFEIGTTAHTISRWETLTYRPTIEDISQLAQFFGVSILEFFPPEQLSLTDQTTKLLDVAKQLSIQDVKELCIYAEFLKTRSLEK